MRVAIRTILGSLCVLSLAMTGCVFEGRCVGGAVRDEATGLCALATDAEVSADAGDAGELPDADSDAGVAPTIEQVAVGVAHICVVDTEGVLTCWGANVLGQLATGDASPQDRPRVIDLGAAVTAVGGSAATVCAHTVAPSTFCWGMNMEGQVGNGVADAEPVTMPFEIPGLGALREIPSGFANTCVTTLLGGAICWGRNDTGQLGIGAVATSPQTMPGEPIRSMVMPLEGAVATVTSDRHTCVNMSDGDLYCVGSNGDGELGMGDTIDRSIAEPVPLSNVTSFSSAARHTCAVSDGSVYCWGWNNSGQAGPEIGMTVLSPMMIPGLTGVTQVATSDSFTCALQSGRVFCWGSRMTGGMGDGSAGMSDIVVTPQEVPGLTDVAELSASFLDLMCALTSSRELYCWGQDAVEMVGSTPGAATVYLDGETLHDTPTLIDPF